MITPLRQHLQNSLNAQEYEMIIIAGDFNLHHPLWNPQEYNRHDHQADELIEMMADHGLRTILPPGTITYPSAKTAIDLVWGNENVERNVIKCQISKNNDHGSDHYPIEIRIDQQPRPPHSNALPPHNYAKTNWKYLEFKLAQYLPEIIDSDTAAPQTIDQFTKDVVRAIQKVVNETTPRKNPHPFSKRWWTDKLTWLRRSANHAQNIHRRTRNERDRIEWRDKANEYMKNIKMAKQKMWREFVENADERTIWTVKKFMDMTPTPSYIPTLNNGQASSNAEKTTVFQTTFFPPPPPADLRDIHEEQNEYPDPVQCIPTVTMQQLTRAIEKLPPDKAPGPDGITNRLFKKTFKIVQHHLLALAHATLNAEYFQHH